MFYDFSNDKKKFENTTLQYGYWNFFSEQILKIYSPRCIIFAYTILNRLRSLYKLIRNCISSLPRIRFLIDLSYNLSSKETVFYDYIKTK